MPSWSLPTTAPLPGRRCKRALTARRRSIRSCRPGPCHSTRSTSLRPRLGPASKAVKITAIRLDRMRLTLDPPFLAAWDPVPRRHFDATLTRIETDAGITGYGSGNTMDGFEAFGHLFVG